VSARIEQNENTGDVMGIEACRIPERRLVRIAALVALAIAACGGESSPPPPVPAPAPAPTLQSVAVGTGPAFAAVGVPKQLTLTGQWSDGTTAALTSGVTWASSDPTVATVDATTGLVTPWAKGTAQISAHHGGSGLEAKADLIARVVIPVTAGEAFPAAVDTAAAFFHVSGLAPGAMYRPTVSHMTDDVDLVVYADASMTPQAKLCASEAIGTVDETCVAPANGAGELWVSVDGQWTEDGAKFELEVPSAPAVQLAGTLAYPGRFPYSSAVGVTNQFFEVTGLAPGARYEVRISNLTADIDLEVHGDQYEYASLCESYESGTVDDFCTATADAAGKFFVELDGETTRNGGAYTLTITAK
jgi:hypothetical protein